MIQKVYIFLSQLFVIDSRDHAMRRRGLRPISRAARAVARTNGLRNGERERRCRIGGSGNEATQARAAPWPWTALSLTQRDPGPHGGSFSDLFAALRRRFLPLND
jgi:hypothetical protein